MSAAAVEPLVDHTPPPNAAGEHPPHSEESEIAVLNGILHGMDVPSNLEPSDFYRSEHRHIMAAVLALLDDGFKRVDEAAVWNKLRELKKDKHVGATLLGAIADGIGVADVEGHAAVLRKHSTARKARELGRSLQGGADPARVLLELEALTRGAAARASHLSLMIEPFSEMIAREIPPRGYLLEPWLRERSLSMLYAPKGTGKTNFILTMLIGAAIGREVFGWNVPEPRRVLIVDGELDEEELRDRIAAICRGLKLTEQETELVGLNLLTLSRDRLARAGILLGYLGDPGVQEAFRDQLPQDVSLIAWDNLSCLFGGEENDAGAWDGTLMFLLRLKHETGAANIFLHHSGKGGDQRGTSRREDNLDNSLRLEPVKKDGELTSDGTHFRTVWAKHRGFKLSQAPSIVCELDIEPIGPPPRPGAQPPMRATWKVTKTDDVRLDTLVEEYGLHLRENGTPPTVRDLVHLMSQRAAEEDRPELNVSRGTTHNLLKRAEAKGLLEG